MPPVRALSADDHELFAETFTVAYGKTLAWVAAAALLVAVGLTTALPKAHHVDASPAAVRAVTAPVTFVPARAPAPVIRRPARHPSPKSTAVNRPAASTAQPVTTTQPTPAHRSAPAVTHAAPPRPAVAVSHTAPPPVSLPRTPAPPAAPPAPDPPPVEAPHPVVPPLPPLPPVTDPQQPDVDRPSLPLGP